MATRCGCYIYQESKFLGFFHFVSYTLYYEIQPCFQKCFKKIYYESFLGPGIFE